MILSNVNVIAFTKLDVLDGFKEIKICVEYLLNGKHINHLPTSAEDQNNLKPIYEVVIGWKMSVAGIRNIDQLPKESKFYIQSV